MLKNRIVTVCSISTNGKDKTAESANAVQREDPAGPPATC
jgi:hypothetical protein